MKWKTVLLILAVLAALAAALLLPELFLHLQTRAAMRTELRVDNSASLLDPEPGDFVRKLRLLSDPERSAFPLPIEEDPDQIVLRALDELKELLDLGAIPPEMYDLLSTDAADWSMERIFYVQPELSVAADFYLMNLWGSNTYLLVDRASGKVMQLSVGSPSYSLLQLQTDPDVGAAQCKAWAAYYGLTAEELFPGAESVGSFRSIRNPRGSFSSARLTGVRLSDSGGNSVRFELNYTFILYGMEVYLWGPAEEQP